MTLAPVKSVLVLASVIANILLFDTAVFCQLTEIENRFPTNVPLKIEFKNQESRTWVKDLEIIATNTGDKPVYYLYFFLMFDKAVAGPDIGIPFKYGENKSLIDATGRAGPNDVPILPGESYTFKVRPDVVEGWPNTKAERNIKEPFGAYLDFNFLNFGDGTVIRHEKRLNKKS